MNRKLLALLGATCLLGTSPSFAQDSTAPFDWTGFHVGAFGGAAFGEIDGGSSGGACMGESCSPEPPVEYGDFNFDDENFLGGMQAGYNVQFGNFVLGLFADVMKTQIEGSEDFEFYSKERDGEYYGEASAELKYLATLQAKFGYAYGSYLFFVNGGAAWGKIDAEVGYSYEYEGDPFSDRKLIEGGGCDFVFCDHDSDTTFGYTLGLGMAAKLSEHMFAELGYSYVNLGDADFDFDFSEASGGGAGSAEADFSAHLIKFGLNWQF